MSEWRLSEWCAECLGSHAQDNHFPAFRVWCPEQDEESDARSVSALDAESAAERWADENDHNMDYAILRGSPCEVSVRAPDGTLTRYEMTGESVPQYRAALIEDENAPGEAP